VAAANDRVADRSAGHREHAGHDVSGEPMTASPMLLLSGILAGVILWRVQGRHGRPGVMIATGVPVGK
jgi:hypothetical protein